MHDGFIVVLASFAMDLDRSGFVGLFRICVLWNGQSQAVVFHS